MVVAQWAIHSGLEPNAALLPVHEVHQLVVVYIAVWRKSMRRERIGEKKYG